MPDTRFTLIGKACVWIVRASDSELRTLLKAAGWRGTKRKGTIRLKSKRKRKARFRKGSPEAKRYMARIRRMRR